MDKGADTTQKIVIAAAIILGIVIILTIGYSLYTKAKRAEGELANKVALENVTKKSTNQASVSLTGEAQTKSSFTYDGLVQKGPTDNASTTNYEVVNETVPVEVPKEEPVTPKETVEETIDLPVEPVVPPKKPVVAKPVDDDMPLTYEEIMRIRQLQGIVLS
jgi:hypothetical protein